MNTTQLKLNFVNNISIKSAAPLGRTLRELLKQDLTFQADRKSNGVHRIHAFAAKFPPQLPRLFIQELTRPGELVLDPMVGSGTSLVEAISMERNAIGVDLDPLSAMIAKIKSSSLDLSLCSKIGANVISEARSKIPNRRNLETDFSPQAIQFFEYWFTDNTIRQLHSLVRTIKNVKDSRVRSFLELVFSSTIISKSAELTFARDLAHSRPHRDMTKKIEPIAFDLFDKRLKAIVLALSSVSTSKGVADVIRADTRFLPLPDNSVHLIFTSPPYASNAIDYMRGHKFSLMWLGYDPKELTNLRRIYIGSEVKAKKLKFESRTANRILTELSEKSEQRASVVANYYQEMEIAFGEMLRVLVPQRAAVLVIGSSTIQGVEIKAPKVLADLASHAGFELAGVATRKILRDARMMPISNKSDKNGIEARMHEEGVIGLIKP